jgi:hypothetical protein
MKCKLEILTPVNVISLPDSSTIDLVVVICIYIHGLQSALTEVDQSPQCFPVVSGINVIQRNPRY